MADIKISALPPATEMLNADELPIVTGGVTSRIRKDIFLTAALTEDIYLTAQVGQLVGISGFTGSAGVTVTDDDVITATAPSEVSFNVSGGGGQSQILMEASVGIVITTDAGKAFKLVNHSGNDYFKYDEGANTLVIGSSVGLFIYYSPGTPGNWTGSAPLSVKEALDRLAACFTTNALTKP